MLLAGDIGGTKTDLAVFSPEKGLGAPLARAEFPSRDYATLEAVAREFVSKVQMPIDRACFAIAGPVIQGRVKTVNLPWVVDANVLADSLNLQTVVLLNDLEATAMAVPFLGPADSLILWPGEPVPGGSIAVIAPGTGLGEAFLTWDGTRYRAHASEGGHADFGPTGALQLDLLRYMLDRFEHVSYEQVCSGLAIPAIYDFLRDSGYGAEPPEFGQQLADAEDRTPLIVTSALQQPAAHPLCAATLNLFVRILGAEAGNLALKVLATGGVYLAGGIPPRILSALGESAFMEAFRSKGRLSELLGRVPVSVVLRPAALMGAASRGLELFEP